VRSGEIEVTLTFGEDRGRVPRHFQRNGGFAEYFGLYIWVKKDEVDVDTILFEHLGR
jgi:hypothetical protein